MKAAWYESQGRAHDVLAVGTLEDPVLLDGEVRIRVHASGINPGDIKKRANEFGYGMPFPRVIPHSDGAGIVDKVGAGVTEELIGQRVWCFAAQTYRPFGTAAEYTAVPLDRIAPLPDAMSFEQGACLGIPAITAYQSLIVAGELSGRTVLVQGGAGAVGSVAVQLAHQSGARVFATCRSPRDVNVISSAGADEVLITDDSIVERIRHLAPAGVEHIVEVDLDGNVGMDVQVLAQGGSISAYASSEFTSRIPFWELLFINTRLCFIGSDDAPVEVRTKAAEAVNQAMKSGWDPAPVFRPFALDAIAEAHEFVERREPGRAVLVL